MTEIRFGCGEFVPGTRRIPDRRIKKNDPPIFIPTDPFPFPGPPKIPKVPVDQWACFCAGGASNDGCSVGARQCLPRNQIPPQAQVTRNFFTKAECENIGFGEEPCALKPYKCEELATQRCPDPFSEFFIRTRQCRQCTPRRNLDPICAYVTLADCQAVCRSDECPDPPTRTRIEDPDPGDGGGGGRTRYDPTGIVTTGPSNPTTYWGCFDVSTPCPEPYQDRTYSVTTQCRSTGPITTLPPPGYIYRSEIECRRRCSSSPIFYPCETDLTKQEPTRGGGGISYDPTSIVGAGDPTSIVRPNLESLTFSIINRSGVLDPNTQTKIKLSDTVDVDEFFNSSFVDNNTSSAGGVYHSVYNIFSYEDYMSGEYESNNLYLNIFADYIPKSVSYMLKYSNSNIEWNEKYITGLSKANIIKSINGNLLQAFKSFVDIDGQAISMDFFLGVIKKHLIRGTIDKFNPSYYITLAKKHSTYAKLNLKTSDTQELNRRAALGILSKYANPLDPNKYSTLQSKLEVNRNKILLTDIEASVIVETIAEDTYTVPLEDPGLSVAPVSALDEYVPVGEGGGYYLVVETMDGEQLPLTLNTAVSSAYYVSPEDRKLALALLGEDSTLSLSVSSSFDDSELGANYYTSYTASVDYYKLDLQSITQAESTEGLIETSIASYVKLTDQAEINEHTKTYGSKASQVNVQFDDPFIQYADRSGRITLQQKDITFRQFNPSRSSGNYSVLTRSLPAALIITPVIETEDNPYYAYSNLETLSNNQIARSLRITSHFGLSEERQLKPILQETLIYNNEGKYKLGLVEQADTQNIYYLFDKSKYPSYPVNGRSETGFVFKDILVDRLQTKYQFDYLTWWDIYRRLKLTEVVKFIYFAPQKLIKQLELGFKSFKVKSVLDRDSAISSVLSLKEGQQEDSVILSDRIRNAKST